jgi:hypothetical protein
MRQVLADRDKFAPMLRNLAAQIAGMPTLHHLPPARFQVAAQPVN